jgi:hypothetical protein
MIKYKIVQIKNHYKSKEFYSGTLAVAKMQKVTIFFIITNERPVLVSTKPCPAKKIESLIFFSIACLMVGN